MFVYCSMKSDALTAGVDGFLVFDLGLVEPMLKVRAYTHFFLEITIHTFSPLIWFSHVD